MAGTYHILLAGEVRLLCDGAEVVLTGKKTRALLGILALSAPRAVTRDQIAALLWSETTDTAARAALRQTLHRLRELLGPNANRLLRTTQDEAAIDLSTVRVDLLDMLEQAQRGVAPEALSAQPNALIEAMAGLDFLDRNFANWLSVRRQRMHEDAVNALGRALESYEPPDRRGLDIARLLVRMEPTHEAACRWLMRAHHRQGTVSAALTVYEKLWHVLEEDYDSLPSEETQRLIVEIKQATPEPIAIPTDLEVALAPGRERGALALVERPEPAGRRDVSRTPPVLQVERFSDGGLGDTVRWMVDGLRDDFIAAFCRFREWRVLDGGGAAAAVATIDGPVFAMSARAVAAPAGEELVITFRDARLGEVIWSERVALQSADWSRMQRRIVRRIAIASSLHLSADRIARLAPVDAVPPSAYDAWLIGQGLLSQWRHESDDRAAMMFRRLVDEHRTFAPAYVGLAQVLNAEHHMRPGMYRSRRTHAEALELSLHAVSLDPLCSKGQLALAWSFAMTGAFDSAVQTFNIAHDLNENDPWTLVSASLGFAYCGEIADALRLADQVLDLGLGLSPLHWAYHAGVQFLAGNFGAAEAAAARGSGATLYIPAWHAAALGHLGRRGEARAVLGGYLITMRERWVGHQAPTDAAIVEWLLHCYPIRSRERWERLRDGLAAAGAPVPEVCPEPLD